MYVFPRTPLFRTRSLDRDRAVDAARLGRLLAALREMEREVEDERAGFAGRYERTAASAAFAQHRCEDERQESAALSGRIDGLTEALKAYRRRMGVLDGQLALLRQIRGLIDAQGER